jgi:aspartate dehydrogenase
LERLTCLLPPVASAALGDESRKGKTPLMATSKARIGLIGLGYLGRYVYDQITSRPELGLEVAFLHDLAADRVAGLPAEMVLLDISAFASRRPDLVVEMAHPSVTRQYGEMFLRETDYMPLSITAFADEALQQRLLETARRTGTRLFIPHGAVVGLENIFEGRALWEDVTIVMKKSPRNLDFSSAPQFQAAEITSPTVLYDGPTRAVCPLFPRNVNSHATVALAGIGFDRTRSVLVADPSLQVSVIEITAQGKGVAMKIERSNPLKGVSGVFTLNSTLAAITRAKGSGAAMQIC